MAQERFAALQEVVGAGVGTLKPLDSRAGSRSRPYSKGYPVTNQSGSQLTTLRSRTKRCCAALGSSAQFGAEHFQSPARGAGGQRQGFEAVGGHPRSKTQMMTSTCAWHKPMVSRLRVSGRRGQDYDQNSGSNHSRKMPSRALSRRTGGATKSVKITPLHGSRLPRGAAEIPANPRVVVGSRCRRQHAGRLRRDDRAARQVPASGCGVRDQRTGAIPVVHTSSSLPGTRSQGLQLLPSPA